MSSDSDHFYLDRLAQHQLYELLCRIPELVVELEVTLCRQDRLGDGTARRSRTEQPLPYNHAASEATDNLHAELVGWVRMVCEQRALEPPSVDSIPSLAKWLRYNIIALAMTEGADEALTGIRAAVDNAWWPIVPPLRPLVIDAGRIEQARDEELNAHGIETVARELGEEYRNLTSRRVHNLRRLGHIAPLRYWKDIPIYRLGDVLDAHLRIAIRPKHVDA